MKIKTSEKSGSKTYYTVEATDAERASLEADYTVYGCGTICVNNKREAQAFEMMVASSEQAAPEPEKQAKPGKRRVELASVAEEHGMNHGACWVCSGTNVDEKMLNPAWEGELICYVY